MSDVLLVGWDGQCVLHPHPERRSHPSIGNRECAPLRVTYHGPSGRSIGHARQLNEEERKISFTPMSAPVRNHCGEERRVGRSSLVRIVRFTLIPDDPFDGIRSKRRNHAVIQARQLQGLFVRIPRCGGRLLTFGNGICGAPFVTCYFVVPVRHLTGHHRAGRKNPRALARRGQAVIAHPRLDGRAAPCGFDQSDLNVLTLSQLAPARSKPPQKKGPPTPDWTASSHPAKTSAFGKLEAAPIHHQQAQVRVIGRCNFFR